jgi:hypothetical protein
MPTNSGSNTKKYKVKMNRRISLNSGRAVPQSFITKGKQRLKQHVDTVYLNNGDEFEIELFNPTQNKVLSKIEINGISIGGGIILRPGERVFLERYLDEAKKFLFETYVVNGKNEEVLNAIQNNGDVTVKFYDENVISPLPINQWLGNSNFGTSSGGYVYPTTTIGDNYYYSSSITYSDNSNATFTSSATLSDNESKTLKSSIRQIETGRVEKGSESNQSFSYDNTKFKSYPSWSNWWKIKPQSTKLLVSEDLIVYCTECGSKRKKDNHKFCPHCGTKF